MNALFLINFLCKSLYLKRFFCQVIFFFKILNWRSTIQLKMKIIDIFFNHFSYIKIKFVIVSLLKQIETKNEIIWSFHVSIIITTTMFNWSIKKNSLIIYIIRKYIKIIFCNIFVAKIDVEICFIIIIDHELLTICCKIFFNIFFFSQIVFKMHQLQVASWIQNHFIVIDRRQDHFAVIFFQHQFHLINCFNHVLKTRQRFNIFIRLKFVSHIVDVIV